MLKKFKIYLLTVILVALKHTELLTGTRDNPANSVATNSIPVSQSMISIPSLSTPNGATLIINRPGQYYLTEPLTFYPLGNGYTVIDIQANDVVLDLASYTITSKNPTTFTNLSCINIGNGDDNYHNIHILNGRINQFTGIGININPNCSSIYLSDLTIRNCNLGGIVADLANNIFLDNVNIAHCNGDGTSATTGEAIGMKLTDVTFLSAKNCTFNSCISSLRDGSGVKLVSNIIFCNDCNFEDCAACHNGTSNATHNAYGFRLENTRTCIFKNCTATDNNGFISLNTHGFAFKDGFSNMCYNCLAASNRTVQTSGTACGFYLSGATNHYFENCEARNQDASDATNGLAYGFYSTASFITAGTGNSFFKCKAHGNRAGTSSSSIAAGFALVNGENRSSIEASDASANQGGSGEAYGIKLGQTGGTQPTFCFINNNRLMNNFGTSAQYGLKDFSSNSKNTITRNQAFAQGPVLRNTVCTDTSFMNFMISYIDTEANKINNILVEGDRAELKVFSTAGPLDNLSIFYSEDIS